MKPSPLTILMLVAILLGGFSLWMILELREYRAAQYEADMLDEHMCVSTTGHKKVPCPDD